MVSMSTGQNISVDTEATCVVTVLLPFYCTSQECFGELQRISVMFHLSINEYIQNH